MASRFLIHPFHVGKTAEQSKADKKENETEADYNHVQSSLRIHMSGAEG